MSIKKAIAGLMACVLMMTNLSAFCFAADTGDTTTGSAISAEAVETSETVEDTADTGTGDAADWLADMGITINLPDGIDIDENGNITFNISDFSWTVDDSTDTGSEDIAAGDDADEAEAASETALMGTVNCSYLNLREGPSTDYTILGCLKNGTEMEIIGEQDGWSEVVIPERTGYVYGGYLDVVEQVIGAVSDETGEDGEEISDTELSDFEQQFLMMFLYMMMSGMQTADTTDVSSALTPDGNLTLVDDYAENNEDGSGKQFITLVTKAGNTFYLIIDRDDEGDENVHFLNLVDERDLLALMDEDEAAEFGADAATETPAEAEPDEAEPAGEEPAEEVEESSGVNAGPILLFVVVIAGVGGFFAYTKLFKGKKKKEQVKPDPDADYTDEDEEDFGLPDDEDLAELEDGDPDSEFDAEDNEPV